MTPAPPRHRPARLALAGLALLLSGSCSMYDVVPQMPIATPPTAWAPPPPYHAPPETAVRDWQDAPLSPGAWHLVLPSGTSHQPTSAIFASQPSSAPGGAQITVACNPAGHAVEFASRNALGITGSSVTIATTAQTRAVVAGGSGGDPPGPPFISLPAGDPLLDAIAFSRGRFALEGEGRSALVLPTGPEIARVIEDCRAG